MRRRRRVSKVASLIGGGDNNSNICQSRVKPVEPRQACMCRTIRAIYIIFHLTQSSSGGGRVIKESSYGNYLRGMMCIHIYFHGEE